MKKPDSDRKKRNKKRAGNTGIKDREKAGKKDFDETAAEDAENISDLMVEALDEKSSAKRDREKLKPRKAERLADKGKKKRLNKPDLSSSKFSTKASDTDENPGTVGFLKAEKPAKRGPESAEQPSVEKSEDKAQSKLAKGRKKGAGKAVSASAKTAEKVKKENNRIMKEKVPETLNEMAEQKFDQKDVISDTTRHTTAAETSDLSEKTALLNAGKAVVGKGTDEENIPSDNLRELQEHIDERYEFRTGETPVDRTEIDHLSSSISAAIDRSRHVDETARLEQRETENPDQSVYSTSSNPAGSVLPFAGEQKLPDLPGQVHDLGLPDQDQVKETAPEVQEEELSDMSMSTASVSSKEDKRGSKGRGRESKKFKAWKALNSRFKPVSLPADMTQRAAEGNIQEDRKMQETAESVAVYEVPEIEKADFTPVSGVSSYAKTDATDSETEDTKNIDAKDKDIKDIELDIASAEVLETEAQAFEALVTGGTRNGAAVVAQPPVPDAEKFVENIKLSNTDSADSKTEIEIEAESESVQRISEQLGETPALQEKPVQPDINPDINMDNSKVSAQSEAHVSRMRASAQPEVNVTGQGGSVQPEASRSGFEGYPGYSQSPQQGQNSGSQFGPNGSGQRMPFQSGANTPQGRSETQSVSNMANLTGIANMTGQRRGAGPVPGAFSGTQQGYAASSRPTPQSPNSVMPSGQYNARQRVQIQPGINNVNHTGANNGVNNMDRGVPVQSGNNVAGQAGMPGAVPGGYYDPRQERFAGFPQPMHQDQNTGFQSALNNAGQGRPIQPGVNGSMQSVSGQPGTNGSMQGLPGQYGTNGARQSMYGQTGENGSMQNGSGQPGVNGSMQGMPGQYGTNGARQSMYGQTGVNGSMQNGSGQPGVNGSMQSMPGQYGVNGSRQSMYGQPGINGSMQNGSGQAGANGPMQGMPVQPGMNTAGQNMSGQGQPGQPVHSQSEAVQPGGFSAGSADAQQNEVHAKEKMEEAKKAVKEKSSRLFGQLSLLEEEDKIYEKFVRFTPVPQTVSNRSALSSASATNAEGGGEAGIKAETAASVVSRISTSLDSVMHPAQSAPIGMWGYFGYRVLFSIPLIGMVFIIMFAFGGTENESLRNLARSYFCSWLVICALIALLVVIVYSAIGAGIVFTW